MAIFSRCGNATVAENKRNVLFFLQSRFLRLKIGDFLRRFLKQLICYFIKTKMVLYQENFSPLLYASNWYPEGLSLNFLEITEERAGEGVSNRSAFVCLYMNARGTIDHPD